jgi:hypothetical protein
VELTEAAAYVDWFAAIPEAAVRRLGLRCEHLGSATALIMSEIDVPIFNRVLGLGVVEPATEELLDHITALYAPSGNIFMVHVAPASQPAELATWLEQRGIRRRDSWAKVYRGNDTPPDIHTDLRIESIGPEYAAAFARTGLTAFGMPLQLESVAAILGRPSWRNYLAFDGDTPVATASLFVRDRIGWLGYGSTLSSHRRRGAQGALMVQRLRDGIEMGCEWFVTETGEETTDNPNPSYHNMLRTGFMLAYFRPNYISMGPQSAS